MGCSDCYYQYCYCDFSFLLVLLLVLSFIVYVVILLFFLMVFRVLGWFNIENVKLGIGNWVVQILNWECICGNGI